ncbi:MAG: glycosyltransferase [Bacteroidales bacterium]|nr:glycosyltransferase [Bacteroidales bacterium]
MASLVIAEDISYIFFGIFIAVFFIQIIYYLAFYLRPLRKISSERNKDVDENNTNEGVSVIIYANNDSESLWKNLDSYLNQEYPLFEVIVVNDGSTDETEEVLGTFENQFDNLYHTFVAEGARNLSRKKLSLTLGIKAAKYDIVLFTNANCKPDSPRWIETMASNFTKETDIVVGYTQLDCKKGFINRYISFDWLLRALRIFGYSLAVTPFEGEGSNMAYRKKIFFDNKGFSKYMQLHIGEDDLFVNSLANKKNTKIELSDDSFVTSYFDSTKSGWLQTKRNRAFTEKFYKNMFSYIMGFESLTRYLFLAMFVLLIVVSYSDLILMSVIGGVFIFNFIFKSVFWYFAGKSFNTKKHILCFTFFELIDPIINFVFKIEAKINSKRYYTWKL